MTTIDNFAVVLYTGYRDETLSVVQKVLDSEAEQILLPPVCLDGSQQ